MNIEKEIKENLKNNRLKLLKQRYFDLELDVISLEASGNQKRANEMRDQMEKVKSAFDAISKVDTSK